MSVGSSVTFKRSKFSQVVLTIQPITLYPKMQSCTRSSQKFSYFLLKNSVTYSSTLKIQSSCTQNSVTFPQNSANYFVLKSQYVVLKVQLRCTQYF